MYECIKGTTKLQRAENDVCTWKRKQKHWQTQREKEREKCARSRTPQDVNALKVCGLNQGHFMNASDYMSVCQSTRKVNNPFVVGWLVGWLVGREAATWLELVWLSTVDVHIAVTRALHR